MNLYHETPTLWQSLLRQLCPPVELSALTIYDAGTQHHVRQIERLREPCVESDCGRAIPMMVILGARSGRWEINGSTIEEVSSVPLPATDSDGTL